MKTRDIREVFMHLSRFRRFFISFLSLSLSLALLFSGTASAAGNQIVPDYDTSDSTVYDADDGLLEAEELPVSDEETDGETAEPSAETADSAQEEPSAPDSVASEAETETQSGTEDREPATAAEETPAPGEEADKEDATPSGNEDDSVPPEDSVPTEGQSAPEKNSPEEKAPVAAEDSVDVEESTVPVEEPDAAISPVDGVPSVAVDQIATDYDTAEGEVHNTVDVSQAVAELPAPNEESDEDSPALFASKPKYNYSEELAKFPASYRKLLARLHKAHSKWIFVADKTGLDFQTAVANEANCAKNVVTTYNCSRMMSSPENATYANSNAVAYYMDPRNFMNEKNIFLFVDITSSGTYTNTGTEAVLSGTSLHSNRTYNRSSGTARLPDTFAKTIMKASAKYNLNSYFVASKIITETGGSLRLPATSGRNGSYPNIYNFYNIGAYTGAVDGLRWAASGSSYQRPWKDPGRSIKGGASYIYSNYCMTGQNTEYYTKFNTSSTTPYPRYTHQYMSALYGALNESERMYKGYSASTLNGNYVFHIPVYNNMPSTCSLLSLSDAAGAVRFAKATKKATVTSSSTLRSGPATTASKVAGIPSKANVTVLGGVATNNANRANQIGDPYWFKVSYGGKTGYVSADSVKPAISYDIARTKKVRLSRSLGNSADKVYYLSSNPGIAKVSASGTVTGKSNGTCIVYAFSGGGFDAVGVKVSKYGSKIALKTVSSSPAKRKKLTGKTTSLSLSYATHPYTGKALKPAVTVKRGSGKLKKGKDFKVTYSRNKEPGTATVKVTGIGNYSGTVRKTFKITTLLAPYRTTIKRLNYRSGCSSSSPVQGKIAKKGSVVNVVYGWHKTVKGVKWYKVKIKGAYHYINGSYLTREVRIRYVTKSAVKYRTGCGTSSAVKGTFKKGKVLSIVKGWHRTADKVMWFKVRYQNHDYYVMAKYLRKGETLLNYRVARGVNVRSRAGTSHKLKAKLFKSTPVSVVKGRTKTVGGDKWHQVKINAEYDYIMASFLKKS